MQMKGRPCRVYANDMKVRIRSANAGTLSVAEIYDKVDLEHA
jgi:hypothetical protein